MVNINLTREYLTQRVWVPNDISIDVLMAMVKHKLPHEITQVEPSKSEFQLTLFYLPEETGKKQVIEQITDLIDEYHLYRYGEHENEDNHRF